MLAEMKRWQSELPIVSDVRGRGLMIGMDLVVPGTRQLLDKKTARWIFDTRSEEHTSELQSQSNLVCRLLLEKKKNRAQCTPPAMSTPPDRYAMRSPGRR